MDAAPRLRPDLSIIAQRYRGQESYVVKDLAAQKYYRFGSTEIRVMCCFDGQRTPEQIAAQLSSEGLRISAGAVEGFARKMSAAGFLERTIAERSTLQLERLRAQRRERRRPRLFRGDVLRMRWSFGDPNAALGRVLPRIEWMFTPAFIAASLVLFAIYFVLLAQRWHEFAAALTSTYSLHNITLASGLTLWLTAGVVILIHELGHGFTCKHFGGEVRELGVMLLYFQPAFYCNVSDAWSFPERRARLWVTAAGSWIQVIVASVAAIMWSIAAPGSLAANVGIAAMLVGGATTLLTNANPLLPLDGYFALADWLEIPNLRHRALAHFEWWIKSRALRIEVPQPPATARERRIFLTYGALSAFYAAAIFTFLASLALGWAGRALGALGVGLGIGILLLVLRRKIAQWMRAASLAVRAWQRSRPVARRRGVGVAVVIAAVVIALLPWTLTTPGEFVVRPISMRTVTAPDSGVVADVFVSEGSRVEAGAPLLRLVDRALDQSLLIAGRSVDSLAAAESEARAANHAADAERAAALRMSMMATFTALERRADALTLRSPLAGVVASPRPEYLMARAVGGGDSLLAIAVLDSVEMRIALNTGGATRVRPGQTVHLISYGDPSAPWTGRVAEVAVTGSTASGGGAEARVRRAASQTWQPGMIGEASVDLGRSTVFGALWWKARQLLRTDLWL